MEKIKRQDGSKREPFILWGRFKTLAELDLVFLFVNIFLRPLVQNQDGWRLATQLNKYFYLKINVVD